jgi:DNA-binding transcriptional ArsR family regulator
VKFKSVLFISVYADIISSVTDIVLFAKALADPTSIRILSALRGR